MDTITSLGELIPDFGPLLSFALPKNEHGLPAALAPIFPTLRALSHDPSILSKAMLNYLSLVRDARVMKDRNRLVKECTLLATKHADLIGAVRAINRSRISYRVDGTIHDMPIELLAHIFTLSTIDHYPNSGKVFSNPFDMRLRAVCRHWRNLIDDTPILWAVVSLKRQVHDFDRLRVVLNRSKIVPLELILTSRYMDSQLVSIISPEMARTRRLHLLCESWDEETRINCMQQLTNNPAPLLKNLYIRSLKEISSSIFSCMTTPCLREIVLQDCPSVSSAACIFESVDLTRLELEHCQVWESIDDMLNLLKTLPKLRYFRFDSVISWARMPFNSPRSFRSKTLHLPQLEYLELSLPIESIALIIDIIDIPASTRLVIRGSFYRQPDVHSLDFASLLNALHSAFSPHFESLFSGHASGYDYMSIGDYDEFGDDEGFSIVMSASSEPSTRTPPRFTFGVRWNFSCQEEYAEIMMEMLSWPGITDNVTNLVVSHGRFMRQRSQWCRLLDQLPELTSVDIYGPNAAALFRALIAEEVGDDIKTISLSDARQKTIALMAQTLDKRVEAGQPKLKLDLIRCDIDIPMVVQLRLHKGVKGVMWDGDKHTDWHSSADESEQEDEVDTSEEDISTGSED